MVFEVSRRGQPLDVVQLRELPVVVGRAVALELLLRLLAEVRSVDQKQHASCAAELDQPVGRGDGHDRLPRAGRHLHERAGPVAEQRLLQIGDGLQLVRKEERPLYRRHRPEACTQGRRLGVVGGGEVPRALDPRIEGVGGQPLGKRPRLVNLEDPAASRIRVEEIREFRDRSGGEVKKRQRLDGRIEPGGQARRILLGLYLDAAQRVAFGLRFEDTDGFAVDEQQVVGEAMPRGELELAHRDAASRGQIHLVPVLDDPAGRDEGGVDLLPSFLLRRSRRGTQCAINREGTSCASPRSLLSGAAS